MTLRKEQEYLLQQAALRLLQQGKIDRREFLTRSLAAGLGLAGVGVAAKTRAAFAQDRPLTPTFYQWIQDLHPGMPAVNEKYPASAGTPDWGLMLSNGEIRDRVTQLSAAITAEYAGDDREFYPVCVL